MTILQRLNLLNVAFGKNRKQESVYQKVISFFFYTDIYVHRLNINESLWVLLNYKVIYIKVSKEICPTI